MIYRVVGYLQYIDIWLADGDKYVGISGSFIDLTACYSVESEGGFSCYIVDIYAIIEGVEGKVGWIVYRRRYRSIVGRDFGNIGCCAIASLDVDVENRVGR